MGRRPTPKPDPLVLVSQKSRLSQRNAKGQQAAFQPTAEQRRTVQKLAAHGAEALDIAKILNIYPLTLRKHFERELEVGPIEANSKVAEALFWNATRGKSTDAQKFWLTTRGKGQWKPSATRVEHTGADGAPIKSVSIVTDDPIEAARAYQKLMNG